MAKSCLEVRNIQHIDQSSVKALALTYSDDFQIRRWYVPSCRRRVLEYLSSEQIWVYRRCGRMQIRPCSEARKAKNSLPVDQYDLLNLAIVNKDAEFRSRSCPEDGVLEIISEPKWCMIYCAYCKRRLIDLCPMWTRMARNNICACFLEYRSPPWPWSHERRPQLCWSSSTIMNGGYSVMAFYFDREY